MATLFTMPQLGQSMEEGTVLQWFKREGESVQEGELLLEVMSDKANIEVEATSAGIVRRILAPVDATVPVGSPLAVIGTADEPIDGLLTGSGASPVESTAPNVASASTSKRQTEPVAEGGGRAPVSPRARRLADARGVPIAALDGIGSGPGGRVLEKDVISYLTRSAAMVDTATGDVIKTRATPLAARIADDLGVKLDDLALGLPGSRVTADAVRRHAEKAMPQRPEPTGAEPAVVQTIPLKGLRKLIADNVTRSRQTAPHVTLTIEVDMARARSLYGQLTPEIQRLFGVKLTYTDILVQAVARALQEHPLCNAALIQDEIRVYGDYNIGVAVATEHGLLVPVLRSAGRKSLGAASAELKALAERCRTGKQTPEDLAGGTFTITNLGAFGIDTFDPIIVPPQSCILGVGQIADRPAVRDGILVIRPLMNLCLSFDHRVLDGAPAARFLQRLKQVLESPAALLVPAAS